MTNKQTNFSDIGSGYYVVRTQAGFKQAYRSWLKQRDEEHEEYEFARAATFPDAFPSVVTFSFLYEGIHRVAVRHEHINSFRERMMELMRRLDESDQPLRSTAPPITGPEKHE